VWSQLAVQMCGVGLLDDTLCKSYLHQALIAAHVRSVSAVFCQVAAFCARVVKQIHVWINTVAKYCKNSRSDVFEYGMGRCF